MLVSTLAVLPKSKHVSNRKVAGRFLGPYEVEKVVSAKSVRVRLPEKSKAHRVINVEYLKPFRPSDDFPTRPAQPRDEQEQLLEYVVEDILKHEKTRKQLRLFTKWLGYPESQATWEEIRNFTDDDGRVDNVIVQDYLLRHGLQV